MALIVLTLGANPIVNNNGTAININNFNTFNNLQLCVAKPLVRP